jgi:two-component system, OmpR family, phosphate regulon sensor histidine kinase PhoR
MATGEHTEHRGYRSTASSAPVGDLLGVIRQGRSYLNILYLLLAFPFGLTYFIILVVGFAVGIGTAVIGVGLLILLVMLWATTIMASFERLMARILLRTEITAPSRSRSAHSPWRAQFKAFLRRSVFWKSLVYLLLEFPFGVLSFCLTITLLSVSLSLVVYPLITAIGLTIGSHSGSTGDFQPDTLVLLIWRDIPQPFAPILDTLLLLATPALGVVLTATTFHALNGMAYGWGRFARLMLGESAAEQALAEARALAAREEARAERSDQRRRQLIVNVSHELRTPIANIRGHVESLRPPLDERLSEAEKQRYLGIVARETERLSTLVDDLLALARADADELHLAIRPTSVGPIVEEVYQALAPLAHRERQVSLVRTIAADLPKALADGDRLAQVLLNLTRNAVTATPVGGLVFLDLTLTVSDTGSGIPEAERDRVFERFYRVDTARTRTTGGFGLGLSIVRDLMQAMGGTVIVSGVEGSGCSFRVILRIAPDPE